MGNLHLFFGITYALITWQVIDSPFHKKIEKYTLRVLIFAGFGAIPKNKYLPNIL